jgi:hypothetical protein
MKLTVSGNPETQTLIVIATEAGTVKYAEEHAASETLRDVIDTVRKFVGERSILWANTQERGEG